MASSGVLDRLSIARSLREIGQLLSVEGEDRFRARAYERGARVLEELTGDLDAMVRENTLIRTAGIGKALAGEITSLHRTGRSPLLDRLRSELPPGVLELLRVPGLGARRIARLHDSLGIGSLADLRRACESGRVRAVRGFGPARERQLLDAVRSLDAEERLLLLHEALGEAEPLLDHLRANAGAEQVELAGPLRRGLETVRQIDLTAATERPQEVFASLERWPRVARVLERTDGLCRVELAAGARVELHTASASAFGAAWLRHTGSARHVDRLLALPLRTTPKRQSEPELYAARGLPFVPPEQREDEGEIEAALDGTLPADLVRLEDLRGFVHCHSTHSDGRATIERMARAAQALGAEYMTVTDHSPSAFYAGGLTVERLLAQWDEIDRLQERLAVRLLRGTESDILADGALDYPDELLARMDVVIASIHTRHSLDARATTRRIVRAMRHPLFKIWGHALGRLLGRRPPVACDVPEILDAVAESRAAIEISGDPRRLELEPRWIREARRRGIRFVISTDAHSTADLRNARYGVITARRGWVRREEVLNALPAAEFRAAVRPAADSR